MVFVGRGFVDSFFRLEILHLSGKTRLSHVHADRICGEKCSPVRQDKTRGSCNNQTIAIALQEGLFKVFDISLHCFGRIFSNLKYHLQRFRLRIEETVIWIDLD